MLIAGSETFSTSIKHTLELQPFHKLNGLQIGIDYNASFAKTTQREFFLAVDDFHKQALIAEVRQQNLNFRLVYNFSVGKRPQYDKWKFLNMRREIDSAYVYEKKEKIYETPNKAVVPYLRLSAGWVYNIVNKSAVREQRITFNPNSAGYGIHVGANYMFTKNMGAGGGFEYSMSSYSLKTDSSHVTGVYDSYHEWETTNSQYLFHLNFIYRKFYQNNFKHVEFIPSLYFGFNQYFVFTFHESLIFGQVFPYSYYSKPDEFRYQFASGLSNTFLWHPFAKNIGLKFGFTYQIDFTHLSPVTYTSEFGYDTEYEKREVNISPLLSKLYFTITYSPSIKLKSKEK